MSPQNLLDLSNPSEDDKKGTVQIEVDKVNEIMIPVLNKHGFNFNWIHDHEGPRSLSKKEGQSKLDGITQRMSKGGSGLLGKLTQQGFPNDYILVQPKVVTNMKAANLKNFPRWDSGINIIKAIEKANLDIRRVVYHYLKINKIHFFILSMTGVFWFDLYTNIPIEHYKVTYKKYKNIDNRMHVIANKQKGHWKFVEQELNEILTNHIHGKQNN